MPEGPSPELMALGARVDRAAKLADRGNQHALAVTRKMFDMFPTMWDDYGDLAAAAEAALVDLYAGQRVLTGEALRKRLAGMRVSLAGSEASPLEQLLVDRVVLCWLQSYQADFDYARALKELPPKGVEPYQRRQDRSARLYLKALRSLADVRRLLIPALQVNIAERQVNISGAEAASVKAPRQARRPPDRPRRVGPADDAPGAPIDLA